MYPIRRILLGLVAVITIALGVRPTAITELRATISQALSGAPSGTVITHVVDGDTFEISGGKRVRLVGVNTPESVDPRRPVQCFGKEASAYAKQLLEGKAIRLEKDVSDTDKYGRLLRFAYLEDGTFVNLLLVQEGYAQASAYPPDISQAELFSQAEAEARAAGRGLWGACGSFGKAAAAAPSSPTTTAPNGCAIKGNISSSGKIYHLPTCPYYSRTTINETQGERWFCTEADALAAGWRKAGNCR